MLQPRKPSQSREVQFNHELPASNPSHSPSGNGALWFDELRAVLREDRRTTEDAFAKLRAEMEVSFASIATQISGLVERIEALENEQDFSMPLIRDVHVATDAEIQESKLDLAFPTHDNKNDPTDGEKSALRGTLGKPGPHNRYVTETDIRMFQDRPNLIEVEFGTPMDTWTHIHDLGYRPVVQVLDEDRKLMVAAAVHTDENTVTVEHTYNAAGFIHLTTNGDG